MPSEDRTADDGFLADPAVGPEDRPVDHRVFFDPAVAPDDAVGADARPGFDDDAGVDETGTLDGDALIDARLMRNPRRRRRSPGRRGTGGRSRRWFWHRAKPAVHDVAVDLRVLFGCADIDPVATVDIGEEGLAAVD